MKKNIIEEKIPEDLGIKIGTKEEKFWTDVKEKATTMVEQSEHEIIIQKHIIKLCDEKIAKEGI